MLSSYILLKWFSYLLSMFADYIKFKLCSLILKSKTKLINSFKIIKTYFWKNASSEWLIFQRLTLEDSYSRKKREHSFDSDTSRKLVKSFKNRYGNEKLNSENRKQKKKIKNDRNRIIAKIEFKKRTFFKNAQIKNLNSKYQNKVQKIEIASIVVSKQGFQEFNRKQ